MVSGGGARFAESDPPLGTLLVESDGGMSSHEFHVHQYVGQPYVGSATMPESLSLVGSAAMGKNGVINPQSRCGERGRD